MLTKVQCWGNSQGLRLSKAILKDARIGVGDVIHVTAQKGKIVIEPVASVRGKYDLKSLVARMPKGHKAHEAGWGAVVGKEAW